MFDILHKVGVRSSTGDVYRALTTLQGLNGWWTSDTRGNCGLGGVIEFHFGTRGYFKAKVLELDPARRVVWPKACAIDCSRCSGPIASPSAATNSGSMPMKPNTPRK